MRLWSLHPRYLDRQGLVALWREGLLAQAVLGGATRGYRNHPQLERFRAHPDPRGAIAAFLHAVADEADRRAYRFDRLRIVPMGDSRSIPVTSGQLHFEWRHLLAKLQVRDPDRAALLTPVRSPDPHPLFHPVEGPIALWERGA